MANEKKSYFTDELQEAIRTMPDSEMNELLIELGTTRYWTAILKYLQSRMVMVQNGLFTIDAFKNGGEIARLQGTMSGLSDLQNMIIVLTSKVDEEIEKKAKKDSKKSEE